MKFLLALFLFSGALFSIDFENAALLKKTYLRCGFKIEGDLKIEMFRRLSLLFDEVKKNFKSKDEEYPVHTVIKFIDSDLKTKIFMVNDLIYLHIPDRENAKVEFERYLRVKKIYNFLRKNLIKSDFSEENISYFEKFIKIYETNKDFIGTSIYAIKFENILYPKASIGKDSKFRILLPFGDGSLYWEKIIAKIPEKYYVKGNIESLISFIGNRSNADIDAVKKIILSSKALFSRFIKEKTYIGRAKMRNKFIRLMAMEFPPEIRSSEVIKAIENIPYRRRISKIKKAGLLEDLRKGGGLPVEEIRLVYLNPLRTGTLKKIIEMIKSNKDLKNLNLYSIRFDNRAARPSVKLNKKKNSYILTLSDFATHNNIFAALKKVPLK